MKNLRNLFLLSCLLCFLLSGCGGPSEEKIAQAQETYTHLIETHNQVVEAHKHISDNSLDDKLTALAQKITKLEEFNLSEMKDSDIDTLIENMNSMTASYEEYLQTIETIQDREEAAVIVPIPFTLKNESGQAFQKLFLFEKGDASHKSDVLEGTAGFNPGQSLTGLVISRDVSGTPWILELENADGNRCEIELSVKDFSEDGESMTIAYDAETDMVIVS
ncbi:MAG: hypothetical protein NC429_15785 [Lachnospiraceae bacterium]|nr:hypothetical protein [Lachnospiraceae bacterium]